MARNIQQDMADYLPRYYEDAPIVTNIIGREAAEVTDINVDIYDVLAQFYIDTATWGLSRWETIFGVTVDEAKPIEQRRSVIKGKLRGIGTVNAALIEQVAEAYDNGTVTVSDNLKNMSTAADIGSVTAGATPIAYVGSTIQIQPATSYVVSFERSANNHSFGVRLRFRDANNTVITTAVTGWTYFSGYTAHYHNTVEGNNAYSFIAPGGTVTVEVIYSIEATKTLNYVKNIQLEKGSVATAYEQRLDYTITVTFVSNRGVPANLDDILTALRDIIPAHLAISFEFTYLSFGELDASGITFGDVEAEGLTFGELEMWDV